MPIHQSLGTGYQPPANPNHPFWLCYTTGSTGRPKGVIQTHRNLLAFIVSDQKDLNIGPQDRLSLLFSLGANIAGHNVFSALLSGASLHLWRVKEYSTAATLQWLTVQEITQIWATPSLVAQIFQSMAFEERLPSIRLVQLVGEATQPSHVHLFRQHTREDALLVNRYGASETGPLCRYFIGHNAPEIEDAVPIGYETENTTLLLLDENGVSVPTGNVGEIVVRSPYLAPGYWRKKLLQNSSFSPDDLHPDQLLYATGDLGRQRADGSFIHMGRKDYQLKIAGHKVYIHLVEAALLRHGAIAQAAVWHYTARDGTVQLVGYVVLREQAFLTDSELRRFLSPSLPVHAIPARFQYLDSLPYAVNGKLFRPGLPPPDTERPLLAVQYTEPATPFETAISQIWESVLEINPVGIHDPFLDLGGNSLQAMRIAARVQDEFGVAIPLAELFAAATVAEMAVLVTAGLVVQSESQTIDGVKTING